MASPVPYIPPDLPPHCIPATPLLVLISQTFGTCIPSYLSLFSTTAGCLSIVSWLFAQMPQIWKNYQRGSVDGLSLGFLAIWLAGDVCNLLGALWTDQMWFQQVIGSYYVFVDVVLVSQYFYFTNFGPAPSMIDGQSLRYDDSIDDDDDDDPDASYFVDSDAEVERKKKKRDRSNSPTSHVRGRSRSLASTLIVVVSLMFHMAGASPITKQVPEPASPPTVGLTLADVGGVLSWCSTLLYLSSRLPQLLLNFRRRSTSGLAISLFVAAFFGNLFYSLSLLLNPLGHYDFPAYGGGGLAGEDGNDHLEWWGRTLPFFLGASGVLGLDAAVGWQWLAWGERFSEDETGVFEEEEDDEDECFGGTQWNRWWPWNGWFEDSEGEEGKALIDDRRSRSSSVVRLQYGTTDGL